LSVSCSNVCHQLGSRGVDIIGFAEDACRSGRHEHIMYPKHLCVLQYWHWFMHVHALVLVV
jgi:hypothetical protein